MTQEEANEILENWNLCHYTPSREAAEAVMSALDPLEIITALRPVSREQVEKMRGEWVDIKGEKVVVDEYGCPVGWAQCSACGEYLIASDEYSCTGHFCPACGAPMTDEAVNILLERLEAPHEIPPTT